MSARACDVPPASESVVLPSGSQPVAARLDTGLFGIYASSFALPIFHELASALVSGYNSDSDSDHLDHKHA